MILLEIRSSLTTSKDGLTKYNIHLETIKNNQQKSRSIYLLYIVMCDHTIFIKEFIRIFV